MTYNIHSKIKFTSARYLKNISTWEEMKIKLKMLQITYCVKIFKVKSNEILKI